jgi:hypothetical protein
MGKEKTVLYTLIMVGLVLGYYELCDENIFWF